jgi:RHS repeat-associated protein
MLSVLLNTLTAGNGGWEGGESHDAGMVDKLFTPENYSILEDIINNTTYDPEKPRAYLNYILFDENMRIVPEMSGAYQANGSGSWASIGSVTAKTIPANGYFAVFLNNKTRMPSCLSCADVFFDQLKVEVGKSNLLEETHYYPHGLPIKGLSSEASGFMANKHKYQSNEYTQEGLNWMNFHNRQYDPQLGRFLSVDPLAASTVRFSPYAGMNNNPVSLVDPLGLSPFNTESYFFRERVGPIWGSAKPKYNGPSAGSGADGDAFNRGCADAAAKRQQEQRDTEAASSTLGGSQASGSATIATNSVTGSNSTNGVAASGDAPDDKDKSEKQKVYKTDAITPKMQTGPNDCSYTALEMIENGYGGTRKANDFKSLYQDSDNTGLQYADWNYILEAAGFKYSIYGAQEAESGQALKNAWAIVAKGFNQGNLSIVLDVNADGSTHAVVPTMITQGMTSGNLTTTVANPWYGMNITTPENYWKQPHVIIVIQKP